MAAGKRNWTPYIVGTAITLLWLGMMGSLVWRHILPQRRLPVTDQALEDPSILTQRWSDTREYMLLTYGSAIVGAASTLVQRFDSPDVHYVANFRLGATMGFAKLKQTISVKAVGELDSKFELRGFFVDSNIGGFYLRVRGTTRGNELLLNTDKNGQHTLARIQLGRRISLLEAVRPALLKKFTIKPGAVYAMPVADPTFSMQQGQVEVRVLERERVRLQDRETMAYKVEVRLNDFVSYMWVDREGNTLRRQLIGKLAMERTDEAHAKKVSPVLKEEVRFGPLQLEQFEQVKAQTLDQLGDGSQSPMAVLGNLLKAE